MPEVISRDKLQDQRTALVQHVQTICLQGSRRNKMTIVFDGHSGVWGVEHGSSFVEVLFSCNECADTKIKSMVSKATHKKNIIVVTNDRAIQYFVRAEGARVMSVEEFLLSKKKAPSANGSKKDEGKRISKTLEHSITSEMKRIWLKENK